MYLIFDTETTGLPANFNAPVTDSANWPRLVELAWGIFGEDGKQQSEGKLLVRPQGFDIPAEATRVHGITTEQAAAQGVSLGEALEQLVAAAGGCQYVVAHNLEYDLAIVGAELHRLARPSFAEGLNQVCTMRTGTGIGRGLGGGKPPKLHELHEALFDETPTEAHRAGADVAACARCLFALMERGVPLRAPNGPVQPASARPKPAMPNLDLDNREFQLALNLIENTTRSVFLTGKAGTGKSTFLRHIVATTRKKAIVVAPTGVAALNAGGTTIHSMFRLPFGIMQPEDNRVKYFGPTQNGEFINEAKYKLIQAVELIIIDEVSMVRADILDAIDCTLRRNSNSSRRREPFGGKQVLLVGDAYQLPPVLTPADRQLYERNYQTRYFFGAKAFTRFPLITVELRKAYRQQDPEFIRLLDRVRTNQADGSDLGKLNGGILNEQKAVGRRITLSTRNVDAEDYNATELSKLTSPLVKYIGVVTGDFAESDFPTARELVLKEGAQVMFVHNDRSGRWVNGTIGRVAKLDKKIAKVEIEGGATYTIESVTWDKFAYGLDENTGHIVSSIIGTFTQLPLKLAWALTVHKSQGLTFDAVEINAPTGFFDSGQLYVALSRCRSFEGLNMRTPVRERDIMVSREVVELYRSANDEQQVASALAEARPNMLYQQTLKLFDQGNLAGAVAALCEALHLRNDSKKPVFERMLRHKLYSYVQANKQVADLTIALSASKASIEQLQIEHTQKEAAIMTALKKLHEKYNLLYTANRKVENEFGNASSLWSFEHGNLLTEVSELQNHANKLRQQLTSLSASLERVNSNNKVLASELNASNSTTKSLQSQIAATQLENMQLKQQLKQEREANSTWWKKLKKSFS